MRQTKGWDTRVVWPSQPELGRTEEENRIKRDLALLGDYNNGVQLKDLKRKKEKKSESNY